MFHPFPRPLAALAPILLAAAPAARAGWEGWEQAKLHEIQNQSERTLIVRLVDSPADGKVKVGWARWYGMWPHEGPWELRPPARPDGLKLDHFELAPNEIAQVLVNNPEHRIGAEAAFQVEAGEPEPVAQFRLADDGHPRILKLKQTPETKGWTCARPEPGTLVLGGTEAPDATGADCEIERKASASAAASGADAPAASGRSEEKGQARTAPSPRLAARLDLDTPPPPGSGAVGATTLNRRWVEGSWGKALIGSVSNRSSATWTITWPPAMTPSIFRLPGYEVVDGLTRTVLPPGGTLCIVQDLAAYQAELNQVKGCMMLVRDDREVVARLAWHVPAPGGLAWCKWCRLKVIQDKHGTLTRVLDGAGGGTDGLAPLSNGIIRCEAADVTLRDGNPSFLQRPPAGPPVKVEAPPADRPKGKKPRKPRKAGKVSSPPGSAVGAGASDPMPAPPAPRSSNRKQEAKAAKAKKKQQEQEKAERRAERQAAVLAAKLAQEAQQRKDAEARRMATKALEAQLKAKAAAEAEAERQDQAARKAVVRLVNPGRETVRLLPYGTPAQDEAVQGTLRVGNGSDCLEATEYGPGNPLYRPVTLLPGMWMELEIHGGRRLGASVKFQFRTPTGDDEWHAWDGALVVSADFTRSTAPVGERVSARFDGAAADLEDHVQLVRAESGPDGLEASYRIHPQTRSRAERGVPAVLPEEA